MGLRGFMGVTIFPAMLGLSACAAQQTPIPVQDAQRLCAREALQGGGSSQPRVSMGIGVGSGGWRGGYGAVGISSDNLARRNPNPEGAYNDCVIRRAGQAPVTPFFEQLGSGPT